MWNARAAEMPMEWAFPANSLTQARSLPFCSIACALRQGCDKKIRNPVKMGFSDMRDGES